jgi:hypothetical protein
LRHAAHAVIQLPHMPQGRIGGLIQADGILIQDMASLIQSHRASA